MRATFIFFQIGIVVSNGDPMLLLLLMLLILHSDGHLPSFHAFFGYIIIKILSMGDCWTTHDLNLLVCRCSYEGYMFVCS
jgi:hypothetical protein